MKITLVTPAARGTTHGNRVSADRYAKLLRKLGHHVRVNTEYSEDNADALIALHARKSGRAVQGFRKRHPDKPVVVVLTGTDLYHDLPKSPMAQRCLELADALVVLQPMGLQALPRRHRAKAVSIIQSVEPPTASLTSQRRSAAARKDKGAPLRALQLAHLRPVKDPFLVARALRHVSAPIEVVHAGAPLRSGSAARAAQLTRDVSAYEYIGELTRARARRRLAGSDVLVLSSKLEGGANVVCEALGLGVPVVCSRIPGSIGLLGNNYPGFFPVGDAKGLGDVLERAAVDERFYRRLVTNAHKRRQMVAPSRELLHWRLLLRSLPR